MNDGSQRIISIHALLAESDARMAAQNSSSLLFLSTLSLRRATHGYCAFGHAVDISIHALLAESDRSARLLVQLLNTFLSTLSLRRATAVVVGWGGTGGYFYPRSPCGERPDALRCIICVPGISIHALLAESDWLRRTAVLQFPHFYPRSPCGERL